MEVNINGRIFIVRELLATELDDVNWQDTKALIKKQVILSANLTNEEYDKLTLRERLGLIKAINDVNGLDEFVEKKN